MRITDGTGSNREAGVNEHFRLAVESSVRSAQSRVSLEDGLAFQVMSSQVDIATSEQTVLLLKNNSKDSKIVITYIRLIAVDAAARNASAYFTVNLGGDYTSGGDAVTPVNMNTSSGRTATDMVFFDGGTAIVTSGVISEIDRSYTEDELTYNKEGALVIAPNGMLSIDHIGSTVAGEVSARVSFYTTTNGGD